MDTPVAIIGAGRMGAGLAEAYSAEALEIALTAARTTLGR